MPPKPTLKERVEALEVLVAEMVDILREFKSRCGALITEHMVGCRAGQLTGVFTAGSGADDAD